MKIVMKDEHKEIEIRLCSVPRCVEIRQTRIVNNRTRTDYILIPKNSFDKFLKGYHEQEKLLKD